MKKIPLCVIEEHHEAFIVWNLAIRSKLMSSTGNTLLHVDEHSDFATSRFNRSLNSLTDMNVDEIKEFTYSELGIASFIQPACYLGIFDKVFWIRHNHKKQNDDPIEMMIRSYNRGGKRLVSGRLDRMKKTQIGDVRIFEYFLIEEKKLPHRENCVLDIDLDYFSCAGNTNENEEIYIEISKEEYDGFNRDYKYHRLNYVGFGNIRTMTRDDRYYYVVNDYNEL
ncbi:MAG: UPF0489 family protein [Rikenellaceae bacterium]|nr:UPF0489 family protein [Rikenellaceae bacterium]